MGAKKSTSLTWTAALAGLVLVLIAGAIVAFQDNLFKFLINPRTPYQTYAPPPAPDYAQALAWAALPQAPAEVDIFYIHSTTYYGNGDWNAPVEDARTASLTDMTALPNEAGPFFGLGALYAPRYRQATLFAFFTHKDDGREARQTAYQDVRRAFESFLERREPGRPIILVGYEQGGLHALRILQEFFENKELRRQLAVAYVIGQATPVDMTQVSLRTIPVCSTAEDVRCIVSWSAFEASWDAEIERAMTRSMVWNIFGRLTPTADRPLICVNPLTWRADGGYAPAELHLGGVPATGLERGIEPIATARALGGGCSEGVLIIDRPSAGHLRANRFFGAKWRIQDFNLFYADIRANARNRAQRLHGILEEESRRAPPLNRPVEVRDSPINPVDPI